MAAVALPIVVKLCVGLLCGVYYLLALAVVWPITQTMLNQSTMEFTYSEFLPCDGSSRAMMYSEISFNFKAWLYCDFLPKEWEVSVAPYDGYGKEVSVGTVKWPTMSIPPGTTTFNFTSSIELDDPELFAQKFLNPLFVQGKSMKVFFEVQKLQLKELTILPVPSLHMRKAMLCKAINATVTQKMPANVCDPWFLQQVPFPRVVPGHQKQEVQHEVQSEMFQMTDFVPMTDRRLRADYGKPRYAMQCYFTRYESSEPPVAV